MLSLSSIAQSLSRSVVTLRREPESLKIPIRGLSVSEVNRIDAILGQWPDDAAALKKRSEQQDAAYIALSTGIPVTTEGPSLQRVFDNGDDDAARHYIEQFTTSAKTAFSPPEIRTIVGAITRLCGWSPDGEEGALGNSSSSSGRASG